MRSEAEKRSSLNSVGESDSRTWHRAALRGVEYPGWLSSCVFLFKCSSLVAQTNKRSQQNEKSLHHKSSPHLPQPEKAHVQQ